MEIATLYQLFLKSTGVCTDTRKIQKGNIYFALKGGNFDGNVFCEKALIDGAILAVADDKSLVNKDNILVVEDVLKTLQALALYHRKTFDIPFIAITGSNGKTTTKELVSVVLKKKFKVSHTLGNLNNHIGIPLTLLAIPKETEIAVIEMGANHQKEIASYCLYTEPTHGVITNIGKAHLEGFGGVEGIKKGKGELYDYLLAHKGNIFLNTNDETLFAMSKFPQPITYPNHNDYCPVKLVKDNPFVSFENEHGDKGTSHLTGAYNFNNIALACCIGKYFGVPEDAILEAIADYNPDNNRSQFVEVGTNLVMLDAYNANPSSMTHAIQYFAAREEKNKVVILGDMFELGEESKVEHEAIGKLINQNKFSEIILCGKEMKFAAEQLDRVSYFENKSDLEKYLVKNKIEHNLILIKGSRGMGLETLLKVIA